MACPSSLGEPNVEDHILCGVIGEPNAEDDLSNADKFQISCAMMTMCFLFHPMSGDYATTPKRCLVCICHNSNGVGMCALIVAVNDLDCLHGQ